MPKTYLFDVVIIGAGIASCHLAQLLANNGVKVALVDRKPFFQAGPSWINAVPTWMFKAANLRLPQKREIFHKNERFIIRAPDQKSKIVINELDVLDVHMNFLGQRLKNYFLNSKSSSEFIQADIKGAMFDSNHRLTMIEGLLENKKKLHLKAKLFVDASGFKSTIRKLHPAANKLWPQTSVTDSCTAAQITFEVKDRRGASFFLQRNSFEPGDVLCDIGFLGGYSLFRCQIDKDLNYLSILCGIQARPHFKSAYSIIKSFAYNEPWLGNCFIEGRGIIPINAPYHQLMEQGLALLGDAACQVYAAHGSGIGVGLIAANDLANTIIASSKRNEDFGAKKALITYQQAFHFKFYPRLYFAEHFRRYLQCLNRKQMIRLIQSKVLDDNFAKQTLLQTEPYLAKKDLKPLFFSALSSPKIFISLLPVAKKAIKGRFLASRLIGARN